MSNENELKLLNVLEMPQKISWNVVKFPRNEIRDYFDI